jgi:hypothetical protein
MTAKTHNISANARHKTGDASIRVLPWGVREVSNRRKLVPIRRSDPPCSAAAMARVEQPGQQQKV